MFTKNQALSDRRRPLRSKWASACEITAVLYLNLTKIPAKVVQSGDFSVLIESVVHVLCL